MSNAPAWHVAKVATLAAVRGLPGPVALQYFYSLVNRDIEDEHVPLAAEFGMGILPWSPLAYGLLTGKYDRAAVEAAGPRAGGLPRDAATDGEARPDGDKRLDGANPFGDTLFTERNWTVVDALRRVAEEAGQSPARIALAWVAGRPGIASVLMGVSRAEQVPDNAAALDVALSPEHLLYCLAGAALLRSESAAITDRYLARLADPKIIAGTAGPATDAILRAGLT